MDFIVKFCFLGAQMRFGFVQSLATGRFWGHLSAGKRNGLDKYGTAGSCDKTGYFFGFYNGS